jgi:hypothetical protein
MGRARHVRKKDGFNHKNEWLNKSGMVQINGLMLLLFETVSFYYCCGDLGTWG